MQAMDSKILQFLRRTVNVDIFHFHLILRGMKDAVGVARVCKTQHFIVGFDIPK